MAQSAALRGRNVVGLNVTYHEPAAGMFRGSKLLAFGEEERFTRIKWGKRAELDNADALPERAIAHCLKTAGVGWDDVSHIAYSYDPSLRVLIEGDDVVEGGWGSKAGEAIFQASLARVPQALSELAGTDVTDRLRWVPHHLAHAASAAFASPFVDRTAVMTVDGIGETVTALLGYAEGTTLRVLREVPYPASLGLLWEQVSEHAGYDRYGGPGKLMGLAGWGRPDRFAPEMDKILSVGPDGFQVNNYWTRFRADGNRLEQLFGPRRAPGADRDTRDADLAAALQQATETVLLDAVQWLRRETGADSLCYAGGVALNCVANGRIAREGGFERLFIQPAAGDAGTALGAALYVGHQELGWTDRWVMNHPYLGASYPEAEMRAALEAAGLPYSRCEDTVIVERVASLLAAGKVVAWYDGASEAGPRALGHRSFLADPRDPLMPIWLNLHAKHREIERPYSPVLQAERALDWLEQVGAESLSHGNMSFTYPVRADKRWRIPAVVHADGHARAQLVSRDVNRRYWEVIEAFGRLTGVPVLVNTSFNGPGEPIVESPVDAVATFLRTGIPVLVLGPYVVERDGAQRRWVAS